MHLILTGATGLVGTSVLAHVIAASQATTPASRRVTHLSILSRNANIPYLQKYGPKDDPSLKIDIIEHKDFESYSPDLLNRFKGADGVVWALGVSQQDVKSDDEYIKITKLFAVKAAKAFKSIPDKGTGTGTGKLNFVYVSGEGVSHNPRFYTPLYSRVKGDAEKELLALSAADPNIRVYNARPGGVDPQNQPDVAEIILPKFLNTATKKMTYKLGFPFFRAVYPALVTPTKELGQVLTEVAIGDGKPLEGKGIEDGGWMITNEGLRRMGEL